MVIRPLKSMLLIERIVHLAKEEPVSNPPSSESSTFLNDSQDLLTPSQAASNYIPPWIKVLWKDRKQIAFDSSFINKFNNQVTQTIKAISQLSNGYFVENQFRSNHSKKKAVVKILQEIIDHLNDCKNKTIFDVGWHFAIKVFSLDTILYKLISPLVQLLSEINAKSDLSSEEKTNLEKEITLNLVSFFDMLPFAVPSAAELKAFLNEENKTIEEATKLFYYKKTDPILQKIALSLRNLGLEQELINQILNLLKHPEEAKDFLIPKAVSSLGKKIHEPFNQVLTGHILQLACNLAPICAPQKEKTFSPLTFQTQTSLKKMAVFLPRLQRFISYLESDFKQRKIKDDLNDIEKYAPYIYKSLKKSPLQLSCFEKKQAALLGSFQYQEYAWGTRLERDFQTEKSRHPISSFLTWILCRLLLQQDPIAIIQDKIEQLKNNEIDIFAFYNCLSSISEPTAWLANFKTKIKAEIESSLDDSNCEQQQLGNECFLAITYDETCQLFNQFQQSAASFDDSFWKPFLPLHPQKMQNLIGEYLRTSTFEIESIMTSEHEASEKFEDKIIKLDNLSTLIKSKLELIDNMKISLRQMTKDNQNILLKTIKTFLSS